MDTWLILSQGRFDMENRRSFLLKSVLALVSFYFMGGVRRIFAGKVPVKTTKPAKALVVWFSQTGHTERIGRIIGHRLSREGLQVIMADHRDVDKNILPGFDIIVAGSPVYYYDIPVTFKQWLESIPEIKGTAVASYSTFGGPGHNQHNTACSLSELLAEKGGVPMGCETFGNMSTFAPTWSTGRIERIVRYRHLPDSKTYEKARKFAGTVIANAREGKEREIDFECTIFTPLKHMGTAWWTKKVALDKHVIDKNLCIQCGACEEKCPVGAINISKFSIDNDTCIFCVGCVNICPVQAHDMVFMGKKVYGFREFLKRQDITIAEPDELKKS